MSKPKPGRSQVTLKANEDKAVKAKPTAAGLDNLALYRNWRSAQHHDELPGPPRQSDDDEG